MSINTPHLYRLYIITVSFSKNFHALISNKMAFFIEQPQPEVTESELDPEVIFMFLLFLSENQHLNDDNDKESSIFFNCFIYFCTSFTQFWVFFMFHMQKHIT